jgi:hypothetical protein
MVSVKRNDLFKKKQKELFKKANYDLLRESEKK